MSFNVLPTELKLQIFSHLDHNSRLAMSQVSIESNVLCHVPMLPNPLFESGIIDNLANGRFKRTAQNIDWIYESSYFHLQNGTPKLTAFPPYDGINSFKANLDSRTTISMGPWGTVTKTIQFGKTEYKLTGNTLHINDVAQVYKVIDIACFKGALIYTEASYYQGSEINGKLFILNPKLNNSFIEVKGTQISKANESFGRIACDEKNNSIYVTSNNSVVKFDLNDENEVVQEKSSVLIETISYVSRIALNLLKNLVLCPLIILKSTWKFHLIAVSVFFAGGLAIGATVSAPSILVAGLVFALIYEFAFLPGAVTVGFVWGIVTTYTNIIENKI